MATTTYTVKIDTDYSALGEGGTQEMLDGYAENLARKLSADFGVSVEVEQKLGARGQCVGPDDDIAAQIYQAVRDIQGSDRWVDLLPPGEPEYAPDMPAAREWAATATAGDYLVEYEDTGMTVEEDPGSRCGYDDQQLEEIRQILRRRDLRLDADDRGLVAQTRVRE